jgi:hypothetical protein
MTANVETFSIGASTYLFWAKRNGNYPYGATGTIANGSDSGMPRYTGFASLALTVADAPIEPIIADGGVIGQFIGTPLEIISGAMVARGADLNFHAAASGLSIYADGQHDAIMWSQTCNTYGNLAMVINSKAKSLASGSLGESGWYVTEVFNVEVQPKPASLDGTSFAAKDLNYVLSVNQVDTELNGVSFANGTNYGAKKAYARTYWSEYPVHYHTHIGDNSDTTLTLSYTPAADSTNKVKVWQAGTALTYGAGAGNVTNSGTTVTFGTAPGAGVVSIIRYEFLPSC